MGNPNYRILNQEEVASRVVAWQERGDRQAQAELVESQLAFVRLLASRYCTATNWDDYNAALSAGHDSILRAIDKFDVTRGIRLTTYVGVWFRNFALRARHQTVVHVPEYVWDSELGKNARKCVSLDGDSASYYESEVSKPAEDPAKILVRREELEILRWAIDELDTRERFVMVGRTYEGKTLRVIGEELGVTRERVRQIETQAVIKLRNLLAVKERAGG